MQFPEELVEKAWFDPNAKRETAERALKHRQIGSFLVRPSTKKDCLALTHKTKTGDIIHSLICRSPQGFHLQDDENYYSSVSSLLRSLRFLVIDDPSVPQLTAPPAQPLQQALALMGPAAGRQQQATVAQQPQAHRPMPAAPQASRSASPTTSDHALATLQEAFPEIPLDTLDMALKMSKGDVMAAVDILLTGAAPSPRVARLVASSSPSPPPPVQPAAPLHVAGSNPLARYARLPNASLLVNAFLTMSQFKAHGQVRRFQDTRLLT
eukprot:TRINITY_DN6124_c0_g1_i3.p1 TRINITY_DN6124_c0_g1~~TRINITY_DN6124_c0_g1_i3.p1  ORF type:complete len:267 (+),score=73.99 TRINITY_DN6124_c0_g1_i3:215-1015(+)